VDDPKVNAFATALLKLVENSKATVSPKPWLEKKKKVTNQVLQKTANEDKSSKDAEMSLNLLLNNMKDLRKSNKTSLEALELAQEKNKKMKHKNVEIKRKLEEETAKVQKLEKKVKS